MRESHSILKRFYGSGSIYKEHFRLFESDNEESDFKGEDNCHLHERPRIEEGETSH